ncbi:methyltransferase domain-containing protein [Paenibacillus sp. LHD-117]|uniref:class I SAM-dependent methyltransferase n=1 Tax=Paenibacillus sp. LHD-117 TaxID=3071412 RepID=UPI0027E168DA|nr:methyltransferase domain-containing protein [Paenibacillus sp. LHD-117]MDQ6423170.1 methyltransferase domain-containing protein [Paenibacillus sp. LHD-117]
MENTIKKQFDEAARRYDEERRGLIPCFDDFYGSAVAWTEIEGAKPVILDLGAGTGLLTSMLLDKFPEASLTLIDFSEEMLDRARARFAGRDGIRFVTADYTAFEFESKFDAVVSSLSIHHLEHEQKRELFRRVRELLSPGGVFVNADQSAGDTPEIDRKYGELWEQAISRSGLTQAAIGASKARRALDKNASLSDQLSWLREAGFASVDCVYKYNEFTVYMARA